MDQDKGILNARITPQEAFWYAHSIRNITCKASCYLGSELDNKQMEQIEKLADILADYYMERTSEKEIENKETNPSENQAL